MSVNCRALKKALLINGIWCYHTNLIIVFIHEKLVNVYGSYITRAVKFARAGIHDDEIKR